MSVIFYPSSVDFVKKSAKQLQRAFPALQLSTAQEATASALGFSSWFDCSKRIQGSQSATSLPDEASSQDERLRRRHQQIRALVDVANLPAFDVEDFVRLWNLTANTPATLLKTFSTVFSDLDEVLCALESGKISEQEFQDIFSGVDGLPRRVADGIIAGPYGLKHDYYQLSSKRLLEMPLYLRGNASAFMADDDAHLVELAFPEFFSDDEKQAALVFMARHEPWLYEWHTGNPPQDSLVPSLRQLSEQASIESDEWFALSIRFDTNTFPEKLEYAIPALQGGDFVRFIETKGHLRGLNIKWFTLKNESAVMELAKMEINSYADKKASNKLNRHELIPIEPLYGSPFKFGPMFHAEFSPMAEGSGPLLSEELPTEEVGDQ